MKIKPQDIGKLVLQVQPNASKNDIVGFKENVLHIRVAAPPIKDKANRELLRFLSSILEISKSSIIIQKGATILIDVVHPLG